MTIPMKGMLASGIWWSWHFRLQQLRLEQQLGREADDILASIMGHVIKNRPANCGEDYIITVKLKKKYREHRNWSPPDTLAVPVRLEYCEDLERHVWKAKTLMFTRESQCAKERGAFQSAESHFRGKVVRCQLSS